MSDHRLHAPPDDFAASREAAHRLAVYVILPARRRVTGRIGLRASPGGFATAPFGRGERVRLAEDRLVIERDGAPDASAPVTSLTAAAAFMLGALRHESDGAEPSEIQLWPEHFDAAFDAAAGGGRATSGASPGDQASHEPYLYVLPPAPVERDDTWNASGFAGAVVSLSGLLADGDPRAAALALLRRRRDAIGA